MPRRQRQKSKTGIYHVMIRGINRQFIFNDELDFMKMVGILRHITTSIDTKQKSCEIYAYCLMGNHLHLLIKELGDDIAVVMKRIGVAYVSYYNKRYSRVGPLFQGRFKSEPVDKLEYMVSLLHYIHMNPVNARLADTPGDYKWSSWQEYDLNAHASPSCICSAVKAFGDMEWEQLRQIVLNPDCQIQNAIDPENITDSEAAECIKSILPSHVEIRKLSDLSRTERNQILLSALHTGIGVRQLARITGIGRMSISRLSKRS